MPSHTLPIIRKYQTKATYRVYWHSGHNMSSFEVHTYLPRYDLRFALKYGYFCCQFQVNCALPTDYTSAVWDWIVLQHVSFYCTHMLLRRGVRDIFSAAIDSNRGTWSSNLQIQVLLLELSSVQFFYPLTPYFPKILFNIIFPATPKLHTWFSD